MKCTSMDLMDAEVTVGSTFLAGTLKFMARCMCITRGEEGEVSEAVLNAQIQKSSVLDDNYECQICLLWVLPAFISSVILIHES